MTLVQQKINEGKELVYQAKEIVYELLNTPMDDESKEKVLQLFRLLR